MTKIAQRIIDGKVVGSLPAHVQDPEDRTVTLYDTTLRDGEQQSGVTFDFDEKREIFRALEAVGVPVIETGFIAVSKTEAEVVSSLKAEGVSSAIFMLSRCAASDISAAAACGADGVTLSMPLNPVFAERIHGWSTSDIVRMSLDGVRQAVDLGLRVNYFGIDATRTNPEWLNEVFSTVADVGGVESVTIADSFGVAGPSEISAMVTSVLSAISAGVQVHCHDDLGLAVANSLAAVEAGASFVQGTVNGLGERAGNADLAQVAMAGTLLHGWDMGVDLSLLRPLSARVAALSGQPISPNRGVTGPTLFDMESGSAVALLEVLDQDEFDMMYAYLPEVLAAQPKVTFGKGSGISSLRHVLRSHDLPELDESTLRSALSAVKDQGQTLGRLLTDDEVINVIEKAK